LDGRRWRRYATAIDFANELSILTQGDERLFISKVEAGMVGGLGLSAYYYPYLPVGAIRQRLNEIRQQRSAERQEAGLFLMLGHAGHLTTREAMTWFVEQAQVHGLPEGIRVVVGGTRTDELCPVEGEVPGLEFRGWLEQPDLDRLLIQVKGVLAPQRRGFGALTRLPELACAGLPVITSRHTTYAINPTPGLYVATDDWRSWRERMTQLNQDSPHVSTADYDAWEEQQPRPLGALIRQLLGQ
jgi:glycosyltransferase involved in cell wall biosynthesis